MFLIAMGLVLAAPTLINIANRVLVEELIPRKDKKKLATQIDAKGLAEQPIPVPMDMALTPKEMRELCDIGAMDILVRGAKRNSDMLRTGEAEVEVCVHCNRLSLQ